MKRFIIEDSFWDVFSDATIGVIVAKGINNDVKFDFTDMLRNAQEEAHRFISDDDFTSNEIISSWRDAFKKFKTKKGARSSIEALLKRVKNGNSLSSINPLVDIYNTISLRYGFPCGGENIDKFMGDLRLTTANGDESFIPLGADKDSPPYPEEIIYKDDEGAVCRCFNWREASRTVLTENTKNAFLCIENIEGRDQELSLALEDLKGKAQDMLGGEYEVFILNKNNREITIED